jgi:hypothetical protein
MGKFFIIKTWLEDREIEILEKYNFKEEVYDGEIHNSEKYILDDLILKGFIHSVGYGNRKYYQHSVGYLQHFDK